MSFIDVRIELQNEFPKNSRVFGLSLPRIQELGLSLPILFPKYPNEWPPRSYNFPIYYNS
jgi:hypothetical protein